MNETAVKNSSLRVHLFSRAWLALRAAFASNARLRWLLTLVALVLLVELTVRWLDHMEAQMNQRAQQQAELSQLRTQVKDEERMQTTLSAAQAAQASAQERLLQAPSEALAQAQLHDWLWKIINQTDVQVTRLTVGSVRSVSALRLGPQQGLLPGAKPALGGEKNAALTAASNGPVIQEIPVTLTLRFTPQSLAVLLAQIESGQWLLRVETLSVRRNERRLELGLVVPVRVQGNGQ